MIDLCMYVVVIERIYVFDQVLALVISKYFVPIYILVFCPHIYYPSIMWEAACQLAPFKKKTTFNIHHIPIVSPAS